MEFSDLIKVPYVENVQLRILPSEKRLRGRLCITAHHLIISSHPADGDHEKVAEVWILHMGIDVLEKSAYPAGNGGTLIIKCKDLKIYHLDIPGQLDFINVATSISKLSHIADIFNFYPFFHRPMFEILEDGWAAFPLEKEYSKWIAKGDWRISQVNRDFSVCDSYPPSVVVPSSVTDQQLASSASFRDGNRFPVLCYIHNNGSPMLRSGQPLVGQTNRRCREDEQLLLATIRTGKRAFIFETRSVITAGAAKNKGGGYEMEIYYSQWRRIHHHLDRWTTLHESFSKLMDACADRTCSVDKWLSRLENSGWLNTVSSVLHGACVVSQCLHNESSTVLVHGAEGLDLTLCITSLAQIILDPDTRTVRGFEALVEREWLQAGHPFSSRLEQSGFSHQRTKNTAPTFLMFLDCVRQLINQYTASFQFAPSLLKFLFENACASEYGTFLGNTPRHRMQLKLASRTMSLWSYVNHPKILTSFLNPVYEPNDGCLWPSIAPMSIILWRELYLHSFEDIWSTINEWSVAAEAKARDDQLREKVLKLRREMVALEKELSSAGIAVPPLANGSAALGNDLDRKLTVNNGS